MCEITIKSSGNLTIYVNGAGNSKPAAAENQSIEWSETLLSGKRAPYEEAQAAVAALGDGWRLPTRAELESIIDLSRHDPAIDLEKFPDTKSEPYWTGTPCAWNDEARWVVYFDYGYVYNGHQSLNACVRAVRARQ